MLREFNRESRRLGLQARQSSTGDSMHPIVYLPCELKARDLESNMLLANELARRGLSIVIGQFWGIYANLPTGQRGVLLANTVNSIQVKMTAAARAQGYIVVGSDQEALPFSGGGWLINIAPEAVSDCSIFLVASDDQAIAFTHRFPGTPISVVGNPRIDLIREMTPVRPIEEHYILFNTGLGLVNSVWGDINVAKRYLLDGGGVTKEEIDRRIEMELFARDSLIALLQWTTTSLTQVAVVRPHPSENAAFWQSYASPLCRIIAGQPSLPWIAHADIVVHSNSTTGLEAALRGKPCLNVFAREAKGWAAQFAMAEANAIAHSVEEAIALLRAPWATLGPRKVPNFPIHSTKLISDVISRLLAEAKPFASPAPWQKIARKDIQRRKFSVTLEEFRALTHYSVMELDDSLVLISPAT
jgi:surface carbohydrate biosynthesis protein